MDCCNVFCNNLFRAKQNATNQNFGDLITNVNYQVSKEALKTGKIQTPVVMPGIEVNDNWKTFKW